jgi:TatA/E family protein of Tat protein translocase
MFLFILDSLGNGELLVILVAALVFFGPRKLPQLSRSVGKSLTEFRRASEDFKRTWAQEAALEGDNSRTIARPSIASVDTSIPGDSVQRNAAAQISAKGSPEVILPFQETASEGSSESVSDGDEHREPGSEPLRKPDWL